MTMVIKQFVGIAVCYGSVCDTGVVVNLPEIRSQEVALFFFFQAEDGIRDVAVTGVQTCALPIYYLWTTQYTGTVKFHLSLPREAGCVGFGRGSVGWRD